ncbi:hypothetical protein ASPVEDRAFT_172681 [Aspergillus versicolor CBS 583.65]|uniref:Uncharacterized protein n=1 Tax=Aspergillus versicolor CBS 583.65 TaxID=1036611 RepID=A0A1L9PSF1_ASPVE|nr:uncharacterized protein ASPVEDRAFT_172681 [Aspergillus versicolor CBS 583.65]OJJ04449.1 hypothetical protein ASPVEDRAFT_172681 [Aspergillus versicolor CBS 583.65]
MKSFDSLPQEIIALVLQNCDSFHQIRSLILTSKPIRSAWLSNQRPILWRIGQGEITGFSDGLIAVRATQIATGALLKGEFPPDPFPVSGLSGDANKPSLEELKQVQTLHQVVAYLEKSILSSDPDNFVSMPDDFDCKRDECARLKWKVWREEFHRAIYRNLAAGAILCRAYHAPIVSDDRPSDFLASFLEIMESDDDPYDVLEGWFSAAEQSYLSKVPLYSIRDYHRSDAVFKPLEDLFIEESRKREPFDPYGMVASDRSRKDQSLFKTFGEYVDIRNPESLDPDHAENLFYQILHFIAVVDEEPLQFLLDPSNTEVQSEEIPDDSPSTFAMFFGSFVPIKITVQDKTNIFGTLALPGLEARTVKESNYFGFQYMDSFLTKIWEVGGIPNCYEGDKRPPLPQFHFAEYMLRKYFCLRFADATYASSWDIFTHYGALFTNLGSHLWYDERGLFQSSDDPIPAFYYQDVFE